MSTNALSTAVRETLIRHTGAPRESSDFSLAQRAAQMLEQQAKDMAELTQKLRNRPVAMSAAFPTPTPPAASPTLAAKWIAETYGKRTATR